jgi:hypothetical protein
VGKIKEQETHTNHFKLITKESFSSDSSQIENSNSHLDFLDFKTKKDDVSTIEIYDSNGLPLQANRK